MNTLIERNQLLLRKIGLVIYDMFAVILSSILALVLRFEGKYDEIPRKYINMSLQYIIVVIAVTILVFCLLRLYGSLWSYAGATELINILIGSIIDRKSVV